MQKVDFTIESLKNIAQDVYELNLSGDTTDIKNPGQFVNVLIDGKYLRRPISVCDWNNGSLTLVFKIFGQGTEILSQMQKGSTLNLLTGLGNGFSVKPKDKPLLIGGGVGVPPLFALAKKLISLNQNPVAVLGFESKRDIFYKDEFESLGIETYVSTNDGSYGQKGFVTHCISINKLNFDYFYACGPVSMLMSLCSCLDTDGQISLEERMGCGFGACMGCSIMTKKGSRRVCYDGPVFNKEDMLWDVI